MQFDDAIFIKPVLTKKYLWAYNCIINRGDNKERRKHMYTEMYVEYKNTLLDQRNTEVLPWEAFCNLCCEKYIEIIFCCASTDPRVNVN